MMKFLLSYNFVRENIELSWQDINYGIINNFIDDKFVVEFAIDKLNDFDESNEIFDLACMVSGDPVKEKLSEIVSNNVSSFQKTLSERKWLYLVLKFVYDNRTQFDDPLEYVESVYAHFDYPESISGLVRYMPMQGKDLGSKEANEQRLYDYWSDYLKTEEAFLDRV